MCIASSYLGAAFSIGGNNVIVFSMETTCLMQFRRSVASHLSLYQVLSLCSLPVVGEGVGGGGGLCQRD